MISNEFHMCVCKLVVMRFLETLIPRVGIDDVRFSLKQGWNVHESRFEDDSNYATDPPKVNSLVEMCYDPFGIKMT